MDDFTDEILDYEPDDQDQPQRNKGGRPRGSRNRPKGHFLTEDKIEFMRQTIFPHASQDMREYLEARFTGKVRLDPVEELEIVALQVAFIQSDCFHFFMKNGAQIGQAYPKFLSEVRQIMTNLEDMQRRRRDEAKGETDEDAVDLTNRSAALAKFKSLPTEDEEPI